MSGCVLTATFVNGNKECVKSCLADRSGLRHALRITRQPCLNDVPGFYPGFHGTGQVLSAEKLLLHIDTDDVDPVADVGFHLAPGETD